jgi:transcriptional regulator with XRE-family HTH domain
MFLYVLFHLRAVEKSHEVQIKQFGARIKKLRAAALLSQQELADRSEIDIRTVQRIEKGEYGVGLHNLFALAAALCVKPEDLLKGIKVKDWSN